MARLADQCRERFGRLDVLCNNAGVGGRTSVRIHELDVDDWDRVLGTNLRGAFLVMKHTLPLMLESGGGSIVNMASIGSFRAYAGFLGVHHVEGRPADAHADRSARVRQRRHPRQRCVPWRHAHRDPRQSA